MTSKAARLAGTAAGLLMFAGIAACGTNAATPISSTTKASTSTSSTNQPTTTTTTPTPCGERVVAPQNCLVAISFIDDEHGFGLYQSQTTGSNTPPTLVGTKDAGRTWQVISQAPAAVGGSYRPSLFFTDVLNGFIFDDSGFFATHDGGLTWGRVMLPGRLENLAVSSGTLWAVLSSCPVGPTTTPCGLSIDTSTDSGRSWQRLSGLPTAPFEVGHLVVVSPRTAFLVGLRNPMSLDLPGELYATTDAGATWTTRTLPCPTQYDLAGTLENAPSSNTLWLMCNGQGSAGHQGIIIYRSTDDGASWLGESSCEIGGLATGIRSGAPCGNQEDFVAASSSEAFDLSIDGGLMLTTDGGVSWGQVRSSITPGFLGSLDFVNPEVGWVAFSVSVGSYPGVWHTTDGGAMWSPV